MALHQVNLWAKAQSGVTSSRSASPNGALRFQSSARSQPNTHYEMFSAFISCIFMRHYYNSGYFIDSRQTRPEEREGSEHRPCKQDQKQLHAKIHHNISQCRCQNTSNGFKQFNSHSWSSPISSLKSVPSFSMVLTTWSSSALMM